MGEISVKTGNNARNGGKNSLNRLIRCVCGKKIGPDPRNFNQRVSLGRNDLLIRTFLSLAVNYTVNLFVMIALVILFYMDWKLLDKHGKASFSKWWILFSPVYIAKRCKAVGQGKMLLLVWLGIWVVYGIGNFAFNGSKAMLERTACEVVTDIYHKQLRQYSQQCENVTLTESEGKQHYGFAQLSDGTTKDITVTEQSDGKIVVYIE
ncbi:hypothetical protein [Klebsiella quasipneumoniae]|uniref:hypothetical protein n=1 Tax=Klebsiella quasipneumoniae TaxID=1463165 RepID=UPI003FA5B63E